jgi:hypothetical protein
VLTDLPDQNESPPSNFQEIKMATTTTVLT